VPRTDPYIYEGTNTLINKLALRNQADLDKAEADFTILKLAKLAEAPLPGNYDIAHLCKMHKLIFEDIFDWAGTFRTIDIEKPEQALAGLSVEYTEYSLIEAELKSVLTEMCSTEWLTKL